MEKSEKEDSSTTRKASGHNRQSVLTIGLASREIRNNASLLKKLEIDDSQYRLLQFDCT